MTLPVDQQVQATFHFASGTSDLVKTYKYKNEVRAELLQLVGEGFMEVPTGSGTSKVVFARDVKGVDLELV